MAETILEADGLRVVFFHRGDRFAHRVEVRDSATDDGASGGWATALESVEGDDADAWPASPPFQQLHVEQRATGPIVFLVGMAGKSHWSAAVEASADRRSVVFDAAVRYQQAPSRLGSEYRRPAAGAGRVVVEPCGAAAPWPVVDGRQMTSDGPFAPPPATVAWKYRIAIAGEDS